MLYEEKVDLTNMEKRGGEVGMQKGKKEVKNLKKKEKEVDQVCSAKLAQEAMFFANKASEKFLELYSREAYACAFLDRQLPYDHPSSESKSNFDFLSGLPADWATIEVFARAMKVRQLEKIAKDPVKSKSSSAKGKSTAEESPDDQPSALNIVSGLKLMSLLQILKDLEGVAAANPTRRASDKVDQAETSGAKAQKETDQSSKDGPDITAVWALMNL
ncbi:hypothetical protein ACH5RR_020955 [Cinchona calisaya]|uniref:Uncharacterized protein n=1 Tax=Cinchona calisaya TaxID=153742 RepID=A0ABD2ZHR2_9GENT